MKKSIKKKSAAKHRASWRGALRFGLVSFPVQAFNAINRAGSDIHLHQLHAECHRRIHYAKVCPVHGEVSGDEIVSGFEYKKGKYIEVESDELDELRTDSERALTIDNFIDPDVVDPLYLDGRMYYLFPEGVASQEPYIVMTEAMQRKNRYGIGQVVFSGKEQLVLVRPLEGILHMAMLNYEAEIRQPDKMAPALKRPPGLTRKVQLAQTLIEKWSTRDFDFGDYEDHYREKMKELIDAKVAGHEIVVPGESEEETEVISLMEALKKSVAETTARSKRKASPSRKRRRA